MVTGTFIHDLATGTYANFISTGTFPYDDLSSDPIDTMQLSGQALFAGLQAALPSELNDLSDVSITGTPTHGKVLTYSSGTSTWVAEDSAGGVVLSAVRVYTADDTWTKPAGLHHVVVELVGGGGGGGGCSDSTTNPGCGMSGGGAEYGKMFIEAGDLGATETVTVGEGGAGGASGANAGSAGETSSFGAHVTAVGGGAGNGDGNGIAPPMIGVSIGGAGGTGGTGGDIHIQGGSGLNGIKWSSVYVQASVGGASHLSGNAKPATSSDTDEPGITGYSYGGGGTGGRSTNAGAAQAGGAGSAGVIIVYEYVDA